MGIFNKKLSGNEPTQTSNTLFSAQSGPIVNSRLQVIKSSEQHTENVQNPDWKLYICTVKMYQYRVSTVLHHSDIGSIIM